MVRKFQRVCEIIHEFGADETKLIPILSAVQEEYRYLPEEVLTFVAMSLNISVSKVYGVASFYAHFSLKPKGKHIVKLCDGTACHVKGSHKILERLRERLKIEDGKITTNDMLFTVETVSCLGACGLAPVMLVNDKVYGQANPDQALKVVEELVAKEAAHV
jgi:NADH-quinone oxidoreductase subunit E